MEKHEYTAMARLETTMWWYRALHEKILCALRHRLRGARELSLLDAGCGTGGMLAEVRSAFPGYALHGIDISEMAVELARRASNADIQQGSVMELPYPTGRFDVVISTDVLYHRQVNPQRMLEECCRVLRPGGLFILNLPAYEWLRSYHDEQVHTRARYTLGSLQAQMAGQPLRRIYATYWNMLLFLPLVVRRKLMPGRSAQSDVAEFPGWLDALAYTLMSWENALICRGGTLPFGSSLFVIYSRQ